MVDLVMPPRNGQVQEHPLDPTRTPIKVRYAKKPPATDGAGLASHQPSSSAHITRPCTQGAKQKHGFNPNEVVSGGMGGGLAFWQVQKKVHTSSNTTNTNTARGRSPSEGSYVGNNAASLFVDTVRSPSPAPVPTSALSRRRKRRNAKCEAKGCSWPQWITGIIPCLVEPCLRVEQRLAAGLPLPVVPSTQDPPAGAMATPAGFICQSCQATLSTSPTIIHCVSFPSESSLVPTSELQIHCRNVPSYYKSYCTVLLRLQTFARCPGRVWLFCIVFCPAIGGLLVRHS